MTANLSPAEWGAMTIDERREYLNPPGAFDTFVEIKIPDLWNPDRTPQGRGRKQVSYYCTARVSQSGGTVGTIKELHNIRYHDGDDNKYALRDAHGEPVRHRNPKRGTLDYFLKKDPAFLADHCSREDCDLGQTEWPTDKDLGPQRAVWHFQQFTKVASDLLSGKRVPEMYVVRDSPYAMKHAPKGEPCMLCGGEIEGERAAQDIVRAQREQERLEAKEQEAAAARRDAVLSLRELLKEPKK
jgi:hypothetical protein